MFQSRQILQQVLGASPAGRLGTLLILVGLLMLGYSAAAYTGWAPGGYTSVPEPLALSAGQRTTRLEPVPGATLERAAVPVASEAGSAPVSPLRAESVSQAQAAENAKPLTDLGRLLKPADAEDRRAAAEAARPGAPIRLTLESIGVDTVVRAAGIVEGPNGEPEWETLPFVAANYPMLGPVGAPGNPVIAGHVVTLREGNVFRDLYRVQLGDAIDVFTETSRFRYTVEEVRLVPPTAVDVMAPSEDARLTLITCGGTFDPRTRTFSDRLVVIGKLSHGERLS